MHMTGNDINIRIRHPDERFIHILIGDTAGLEQGAVGGAFKAFFDHIGAHEILVASSAGDASRG
jgi:hypothetical protein